MRFVDDDRLSYCLTISTDIKRDELLSILGMQEPMLVPQAFDDFVPEGYQPGTKGLLNVFEDGDLLVTLENGGFLGAARRTLKKVASIGGVYHYVGIYCSSSSASYQYVEVQDGTIVANFDALLDDAPEAVTDFFPEIRRPRRDMIAAAEHRMETKIKPSWLEQPTDTYVIDYRTDRY